jgi:hypothetical protein
MENLTQKPLNVFWFDEDKKWIKAKLFLFLIKHRAMKRYKAVKLVLHTFLSALEGAECLASLPVRFIHRDVSCTFQIEGRLGLKTGLDTTGNRTPSSQLDHPVVWSLSWLRYPVSRIVWITQSLTHSWSWALLEKLPIVQLLENFPAFYGTRRFITAFTRALHRSLSWARSIQSLPSHPTSLRSILMNRCVKFL